MDDIKVLVDEMDQATSEQLQKYAGAITEDMKDSLREAAIGEIDRIYSVFGDQMASNFDVWPVLGTRVLQEPSKIVRLKTYKEHVDYLRDWLERRFDWLDGYYSDPETRYKSTEWKDRAGK